VKAGEIWISFDVSQAIYIVKKKNEEIYTVAVFGLGVDLKEDIKHIMSMRYSAYTNEIGREQIIKNYNKYYEEDYNDQ